MLAPMPVFRPEIAALSPYVVGRPIEEVVREHGIDPSEVVKLASNESPFGPFPGVVDAVAEIIAGSNRYPDNDAWDLTEALSKELGVERVSILLGNGSVALISDVASAVGGPGTNVVYGWPSFVMYRFAAIWAGSTPREVPLLPDFSLDLPAMLDAIDRETRLIYVCNPNNPTGTVRPASEVEDFVSSVPEDVLVVVDEAYHEFAGDPYRSLLPMAAERSNLLVFRTFSKIFSLAAHRIGYAVGHPETIAALRKVQAPMTVSTVAQAAALASLGQPEEIARRVVSNRAGLDLINRALEERGVVSIPSHTNFVFFRTPIEDERKVAELFTRQGVIIRPMSRGWIRVTVGTDRENGRFVDALDTIL
jgi:histidinol-phosphate aminotransferase